MASLEEALIAKTEFETLYWALDSSPFSGYITGVRVVPDHQGWGAALEVRLRRELPSNLTIPKTFNGVPVVVRVVGESRPPKDTGGCCGDCTCG